MDYKIPYKMWISREPNLNIKIFGCHVMGHVPRENRLNLDSKAIKMIFMGIVITLKATDFMMIVKHKFIIVRI